MSFFHNLNKTLDSIAAKPEAAQLNERDMSRAAKGYEKYGKEGMQALAKAGREGKSLDPVRNKYDKYDESVDEGFVDTVKKAGDVAKKVGSAVLNKVGHGSDADMIRDLQKKMGLPPTGEKPMEPKEGNAFGGAVAKAKSDGIQPGEKINVGGKEYPVKEAGMTMTPKQKSFAALAEPKDKITFADKIAGAKQEVDEMLGDVAAEAMKDAIGKMGSKSHQARTTMKHIPNAGPALKKAAKDIRPGVKGYPDRAAMLRAGGVDEEEDLNPFTNYKKPRADRPKVGSVEHGALHDIEHTATGRKVTRRVDPNTGNSVGADDDTPAEKRGRGRPTGTKKAMGAKGPSGKSKLMTREGGAESSELKAAAALLKKAGYKITKSVEEEKTTTRDNHAEKAGKKVTKDIEYDEKKKDGIHGKKRGSEDNKAEKAGKKVAKDIEYDEKKSEKEDKPKKSKSGFKFGEGVYEGLDAQLESLITEGMSVSVNMNNQDGGEGTQSISINADGEDATALSELLKNAGMSQGSSDTCPTCGSSDCGCGEMVDEVNKNNPNWPSNTETSNDALQYSGGLNKPKSTGQSTTPVLASQLRRQVSMEESAKLERSLFSLYKNYTK
jgi:hypothetical protein